jgi:TonB-linked SusC/RagA family outer membrane protein
MKEPLKFLLFNYLKMPIRLQIFFRLLLILIAVDFTAFNMTVNAQVAQRISVSGTVVDGSTGEPLPAVNIVVQGTQIGISTDVSGKFTINVPGEESVLVFTFIGYTSQSITVGKQRQISVSLKPDLKALEEVVVVGYGVQKKESVVGAITQATGEIIRQQARAADLGTALKGSLPGLISLQSTGIPGGVDYGPLNDTQGRTDGNFTQIFIRGQKTWNASSPLVLVDGVERPLNNINPYEIEKISLLKDASATAVFGVKGANGVILITTLRGQEGKAKLTFDATMTAKSISKMPSRANSYIANLNKNYAILNEVPLTESSWPSITPWQRLEMYKDHTYPDYLPDVDWAKKFTRSYSFDQNFNLSVTGGTKLVKYYGSLAYLHEGDILNIYNRGQGYDPSFEFNRINFRSNLDFDVTSTTRFSANLSGSFFVQKKPSGEKWGAWAAMYQMPPDVWPIKYSDGTWGNRLSFAGLTNGILEFNYAGYALAKGTNVNTDFVLDHKLDFITKGL